jgi:general secretion pathway protein C
MKAILKHYQILLNLLALAVIIFVGVDIFYRILGAQLRQVDSKKVVMERAPDLKRDQGLPSSDYQAIVGRNIFGSIEREAKELKTKEAEEIEAVLEPTSLKIALLGTVVGDQQSTVAVIEDIGKKKQDLYREGDTVQEAVIKKILRGKVILRVGDKDEILTIEERATSKTEREYPKTRAIEKGTAITVSRSNLQQSLENIHQLLSQARVRPHFRDGKTDGLAISNIKAGSLFAKLGLKNGDIVQGIDGRSIKSPDDVMEVYRRLRSGSEVALQISRRGEQKILNYKFR